MDARPIYPHIVSGRRVLVQIRPFVVAEYCLADPGSSIAANGMSYTMVPKYYVASLTVTFYRGLPAHFFPMCHIRGGFFEDISLGEIGIKHPVAAWPDSKSSPPFTYVIDIADYAEMERMGVHMAV